MRTRKIIAGNWKMNMLPNEAMDYISNLEVIAKNSKDEIVLCVPYVDLFYSLLNAQNTNIHIGAQNMHFEETGAFTGEVSGLMLSKINCEYVIIGHSERRQYFNETDETVNKKVKAAIKYKLKPIICIGESLEQKEEGKTEEVLRTQTKLALEGLTEKEVGSMIIAYEPIWAIGTGKTATKEDANESIKSIRDEVKKLYGENAAENINILYGGSVNDSNAKDLLTMSDIDGALVGGASLNVDKFGKIINYND